MASQKRQTGIGTRMKDFFFEIEDPDGNKTVISGEGDDAGVEDASEEGQQPAAANGEADGDGIDWANVASEARTMVELNRSATENWQAGEQKGKQDPQDG